MRYTNFEWLAMGVGGLAVAGTIVASYAGPGSAPMVPEVIAQVLLLGVLFAAVHWGRNGGFIAATLATVVYIVMQSQLLVSAGLDANVLSLVAVRAVTYGVVGIVGGEISGRIKYVLARIGDTLNVDDDTQVYNQRFLARLIENNLGQHTRYGTPFSLGFIELAPALTSELKPSRRRAALRSVANHMRNDVRLVDDVGRLDDGRFVLVLPHTPKAGAVIAVDRVRAGARDIMGARDGSVQTSVLAAPEDLMDIQGLVAGLEASLVPAPEPQPRTQTSGS